MEYPWFRYSRSSNLFHIKKKALNLNILEIRKYHVTFRQETRYFNVLQSRLRNRCSALNSDLYRANLIPNALCSCGKSDEHCENYIVQRNIFLTGIREINNNLPIDELTLWFDNEILNDEKNTQIFLQVQKISQDTGRFTIMWLLCDKVRWCLYCLPFVTDLERLFLLFFFFFLFTTVCDNG